MRAIEDIKQDIKLQERAISYLASVGCDDDAMMSDRRLDYLKTELEFAEKCKECKKKREPLELKWIPIAEELPEKILMFLFMFRILAVDLFEEMDILL